MLRMRVDLSELFNKPPTFFYFDIRDRLCVIIFCNIVVIVIITGSEHCGHPVQSSVIFHSPAVLFSKYNCINDFVTIFIKLKIRELVTFCQEAQLFSLLKMLTNLLHW